MESSHFNFIIVRLISYPLNSLFVWVPGMFCFSFVHGNKLYYYSQKVRFVVPVVFSVSLSFLLLQAHVTQRGGTADAASPLLQL